MKNHSPFFISITKHIHKQLAQLPVALTGLALGIAGLTGSLQIIFGPLSAFIGSAIAGILLLLIATRNILHFQVFLSELSHPILGSFIPTFAMALMVIASTLLAFTPLLARSLWYFAVIFHIFIFIQFMRFRIKEFSLHHLIPSWFVPPVGIVVACVTSIGIAPTAITQPLLYFGLIAYCFLLPIMLYRIMFGEKLTDIQIPTFAIMGAPANLCLAGLLTILPESNPLIITFLVHLALFTTLLVYIFFFRIFQMPFAPSFSALTFPLAIGATAMIQYSAYLKSHGASLQMISLWNSVAYIELTVASCVIAYVFIRILIFLYKHFALQSNS